MRVITSIKVVLATCHLSSSRQLFNEVFDVVIIDEVTQALEAVSPGLPGCHSSYLLVFEVRLHGLKK